MHKHIDDLYEIKENVLEELASYKDAREIDPAVAGQIKTLASAAEKLCHLVEEMEQGGSSGRGSSRRGLYGGVYEGGSREGGSREGGSYEGGSSGRRGRNAMGRFTSRDSGGFHEALENALEQAPGEMERSVLQDMLNRQRR